jgi:hypothetical protein
MDHIGIGVHQKDSQICILAEGARSVDNIKPIRGHGPPRPGLLLGTASFDAARTRSDSGGSFGKFPLSATVPLARGQTQ